MDSPMTLVLASCVVVLLSTSVAEAQDPRATGLYHVMKEPLLPVDPGDLTQSAGNDTLTWSWIEWPTPNAPEVRSTSVQVPFIQPGDCIEIGAGFYLVSGWDQATNTGHLTHLHLDYSQRQMTIILSRSYPGIDPWQIAWDKHDGTLFLWDYRVPRLLAVPYAGIAGGLVPETLNGAAEVGGQTLPALTRPNDYQLFGDSFSRPASGDGVRMAPSSPLLWYGTASTPRYKVFWTPAGGWTVTPYSVHAIDDAKRQVSYFIRHGGYSSTRGPVLVKGPAGPYSIVDIDSETVVQTGTLSPPTNWWLTDDSDPQTWLELPITAGALEVGKRYQITGAPGTLTSRVIAPLLRYGYPSGPTGAFLFQLIPGDFLPSELAVGSQDFGVTSGLFADRSNTLVDVQIWLLVGFRLPDGTDPVTDLGNGTWVLNTELVLGPKVYDDIQSQSLKSETLFKIPIPNEPDLPGQVVLFQYIVVAGADALVSDVFGGPILPAATAAATSGGTRLARDARSLAVTRWRERIGTATTEVRERVERWQREAARRGGRR